MAVQTVAFIGARGHTAYALRGLEALPHLRVTAVADVGADCPTGPITQWCDEHGHSPQRFHDWQRMLDEATPDLLVVLGPFEQHGRMTTAGLERGCHVFAEKPVAFTMDDLARLRETVARHPRSKLSSMMAKRYDAGFYTAHRLIRSGAVGDVRLVNARKSYRLGKRDGFYRDRSTYGGTIPWVGSHAIDWILWMAGQPIETVTALHSSAHSEGNGTMERSAACLFSMPGGRIATASIDVFRPSNAPTHGDDWVRVVGTAGVIEAREKSVYLINGDNDGSKPVETRAEKQIFTDFVAFCDGTASAEAMPALVTAQQTLELTEVCLLARQSADNGGAKLDVSRGTGYQTV